MTLIDSHSFNLLANSAGTLIFLGILLWALWFASRMD